MPGRKGRGAYFSGPGRRVDSNPEEAQKTFDLLGSNEKELLWIEGTTRRFSDGYNYFGRHPEKVIPFLADIAAEQL
jgi:hypothetical protein